MTTDINYVLVPIMLAALIALWPAWLLLYRVAFSSRHWWVSGLRLILVLLLTVGLGALAFHIPFWLSSGKSVGLFETLIDLLLYGVFPLVAVGLIAYAMDHFSERPLMIVLAAATCISVAGLPVAYYFLAESYRDKYDINLPDSEESETSVDSTDEPTAGDVHEAPASTSDESQSMTETEQDRIETNGSIDSVPRK